MAKSNLCDLLGYDGLKIYQDSEAFSFSIDSLLLADFVKIKKDTKRIADICAGNGPVSMYLSLKSNAQIKGIEIQESIANLFKQSVEYNKIENIEVINANLIDVYKITGANVFDIVCVNPPYFKVGEASHINKNEALSIARHEIKCNLDDIIKEASRLLVDGGALYMVHRVSRLQDILATLSKYHFGAKDIRFVYPKIDDKEALLVLIEAKKNKPDEVKVLDPLYIYLDNLENKYTEEVLSIFNYKKI